MTTGVLEVLSVGHGETRINIDAEDPESLEKAKKLIQTLLKRGAAILVETEGGERKRVKRFNPKAMTYIIDDTDILDAVTGATPKREVPAAKAKAVAVGRTAGG